MSLRQVKTIPVTTSCDRLYKKDSKADGIPIFSIFLMSPFGKGLNSLNIDGFSTFLNTTTVSITAPTIRLKVVAIATPKTPSLGKPHSPSTKKISSTVFIIFITTVTYIDTCVIPWFLIITDSAFKYACKNRKPPTISKY